MTNEERESLVSRLRDDELITINTVTTAANQIEADGRRIAELESWKAAEEAHHHHLLKRRIAELEAAIREITGT